MTESTRTEPTADATLELTVNGEPRRLPEGSTVADLLNSLDRHPRTVAVELNGDIVRRPQYGETRFTSGDRVEVVHFVQGG